MQSILERYKNDLVAFYADLDRYCNNTTNYKNMLTDKSTDFFKNHAINLYSKFKDYESDILSYNKKIMSQSMILDDINIVDIFNNVSNKKQTKILMHLQLLYMSAKQINSQMTIATTQNINNNDILNNTLNMLASNNNILNMIDKLKTVNNQDIKTALEEIKNILGSHYDNNIEAFILDIIKLFKSLDISEYKNKNMSDIQILINIISTKIVPIYKKYNINSSKLKQIILALIPKLMTL